jgi:hypothetical protein
MYRAERCQVPRMEGFRTHGPGDPCPVSVDTVQRCWELTPQTPPGREDLRAALGPGAARVPSDFATVRPIPGREDEYREYCRDLKAAEGPSSKLKIEEPDEEGGSPPRAPKSEPRHKRIAWGLIALGGALLIVALWLILRSVR